MAQIFKCNADSLSELATRCRCFHLGKTFINHTDDDNYILVLTLTCNLSPHLKCKCSRGHCREVITSIGQEVNSSVFYHN